MNSANNVISLAEEAARRGLWTHRRTVPFGAPEFVRHVVKQLGRWHHHPRHDQTFVVIRGEVIVEYRDSLMPVKLGEIYTIPAGTSHRLRPCEGEAVCMVMKAPDLLTIFDTGIGEWDDLVH